MRTVLVTAAVLALTSAPALAQDSIRPVSRVAVFPIQHEMLPAQVGVILSERVAARLLERDRGVSVLGPTGVLARLVQPDIQDAWNRFLFTFTTTGIVDPVELERVCEDLGASALLDLELADWVQREPTYAYGRRLLEALRVGLRAWWFGCSPPHLSWERWSEGISVAAPTDTATATPTTASASAAAAAAVETMLPLIPPVNRNR